MPTLHQVGTDYKNEVELVWNNPHAEFCLFWPFVWSSSGVLILIPGRVGISHVVQRVEGRKQTDTDLEQQNAGRWSWHFLTFSLCMYGYRKNSAKIWHSYQRCWLISGHRLHRSMSHFWFHTAFRLVRTHILQLTDQPRTPSPNCLTPHSELWMSDALLRSFTSNWLTSFIFFFFQSRMFTRAQLSVCSSRQNRQRVPLDILTPVKNAKDKILFWTPIHEHTQRPTHIHPYIYIIILIMSRRQHGHPRPSIATSPYHSSPPAGLQGYILCPHIVAVCKFELVVLFLYSHMWGSTVAHHLWARPCFSSRVLRVCFV